MRTLRTLFGILGVVALVTFAYSRGGEYGHCDICGTSAKRSSALSNLNSKKSSPRPFVLTTNPAAAGLMNMNRFIV